MELKRQLKIPFSCLGGHYSSLGSAFDNTCLCTVTFCFRFYIQSMQALVSNRMKEGRKVLLILAVLFLVTYIYLLGAIGGSRSEGEGSDNGTSEQKYQKFLMRTLRELNAPQVFSLYICTQPNYECAIPHPLRCTGGTTGDTTSCLCVQVICVGQGQSQEGPAPKASS